MVLPSSALHFMLLGDWGMVGLNQSLVASQMALYASAQRPSPSFIVALGDNFYLNGVANDTDNQWANTFREVYSFPSLQIPWYAILGKYVLEIRTFFYTK